MHHHTALELWSLYFLGQLVHVLKRSDLSSGPVLNYFRTNWRGLAVRLFLASAIFSYWIVHPDAVTQVLALAHVNWSLTLAPEHATAALSGFFSDSGIDWAAAKFSWLRPAIPCEAAAIPSGDAKP